MFRPCLFVLLVMGFTMAYAQKPTVFVSLTQITADGLLLSEGWRFWPGDNPNGANQQLDDRHWQSIDPTQDFRDLPQLQKAGIGWLRLHLTTGPHLPIIMVNVFQSVASEIYLDGQLLYRFGTFSNNLDSVRAYNPNAGFSLPLRPSTQHVLAVRFACEPGLNISKRHLRWDAAALQLRLIPTTELPAIQPLGLQSTNLDSFKTGISFILFILHLSLFFAYRRQRANLYAAGMYLILALAFWGKTANVFAHWLDDRMLIFYLSLIDAWVPSVVILTFYSLFNFRRGWLFWLAFGSTAFRALPISADFPWLYTLLTYYLQIELIRIAVLATRQKLQGARIVRIGVFCNLAIWLTFSITSTLHVPIGGNEWFFHILYLVAFLCIPLTLSLKLALEHGWFNRQLIARLQEVEELSARNLAQQQERQQLLAQQNEYLEEQVAERTDVLNQQADKLLELDVVKSRFFSNITHEFRTPLSLIISPVEKLLQESRFDRSMLTLVHRNAEQLMRLINQLLDLSKLEGNYMPVSLRQGDVREFINQIVDVFQRAAQQKAVTLSCVVDLFPAQEYVFDADKWEKILTNLLSNALKFTPSGGEVSLTLTPIWTTNILSGVQIQLVDSGVGIEADQLPHIFDRFYQADTSSTRHYEGTGIGLALVKELVDLLGGTITVQSQLSVGTTFQLMLPVLPVSASVSAPPLLWSQPTQPNPAQPVSPVPAMANEHPDVAPAVPSILIVEDNDELREFLVGELASTYQVLQAGDGQAGWALTQSELPDVVLTDVMMPRMDGHELTRLIKSHDDTNHIAVVMLTAKSAQQSRLEGLQKGADDYLSKPFSVAELQLRLHNLITRQQKLGDYYRQQFSLPGISPALPDDVHPAAEAPLVAPDPFLQRIYALLEKNLDDPSLNVDWLADQLAMNRKTLYRKVQSVIQLPPAELIRTYRLRRAAELLRSGHTVAETADLVGFSTPSHFGLVFKEVYQQTPSDFAASR